MAGYKAIEKKIEGLQYDILQYKTKMIALKSYCQVMNDAAKTFREQAHLFLNIDEDPTRCYLNGKAEGIENFVKMIQHDILGEK